VLQYLSPHLIRDFRLFKVFDDAEADAMSVDAIHDERGYREIRRALARLTIWRATKPDIQIRDVDLAGDRCLVLSHAVHNGIELDNTSAHAVMSISRRCGATASRLEERDATTDQVLKLTKPSSGPDQPSRGLTRTALSTYD